MTVTNSDMDHCIFLCAEAAVDPRRWQAMIGKNEYVFPSPAGRKHIGRESIEKVYRVTLGLSGRQSPHGWRSAFSTMARDHGFERAVIELALDFAHDNEVARAYDRGERFAQRIDLFQWWGRRLAIPQHGAKIIPLKGKPEATAE